MVAVPVVTPVTLPVTLIVATVEVILLQTPPLVASLSSVLPGVHNVAVPEMLAGVDTAFTVTTVVDTTLWAV